MDTRQVLSSNSFIHFLSGCNAVCEINLFTAAMEIRTNTFVDFLSVFFHAVCNSIYKKGGEVKLKQELFNLKEDMKFDAVVGNPPYQESISSSSGNASLSKQLFPDFVKASINLKPNLLSLITPSRWFTGVAQDKSFLRLRKFIKKNNHFIKIVNFPDASLIFPNVLISGGVNYFLYSYNYNDDVQFVEVYNENNQVSTKRPLFYYSKLYL
ncbi:MAG TPA: hypothetical protein GXX64_11095, partial [Bacteroidales bacterium]|nr:hypothetical protein [Bacteroidales bacterium]